MKKILFTIRKIVIIFSFLFVFLLISVCFGKKQIVYAAVENNTAEELGYAINVIKTNDHLRFNLGAPVLEPEFLENLSAKKVTNVYQNETINKSTSFSDISKKFSDEFSGAISGGTTISIFKGSIKNSYESMMNTSYSNYVSQYYGRHTFRKVVCELALPNYSTFAYTYQKFYSESFLRHLEMLNKNRTGKAFIDFFDKFGTHVIVSALYGGQLENYYSVLSDKIEFTSEVKNAISNQIQISVDNLSNINSSTKLEFTSAQSNISQNSEFNSRTYIRGGKSTYKSNLENEMGGYYIQWKNTINEENAALIGYSDGGLLPLWEVLPSQYAQLKSLMRNYFNAYAKAYNDSIQTNFEYNGKNYTLDEYTDEITLRTDPVTINDSGRFNNHYDIINLKDLLGVYKTTLEEEEIKKIYIKVSFDAREVNDGYQYVFLYAKEKESGNTLFGTKQFEHTAGKKNTSYKHYTFEFQLFVSQLFNEKIYIRYGASGSLDDDWKNKNLKVEIKLTKNV
jgi:MAC/Perforin domain.